MSKAIAERRAAVSLNDRSSSDLRRELKGLIDLTVANLQRMAALVAELESRGEDLSGLRISLLPSLRLIAAGRTLAEVVMRLADRPMLLQRVAALPITEQKQLLDKGTVSVLVDGEPQPVKLLALPFGNIQQVFAQDHIRTPEEQRVYLAAAKQGRRSESDEPKRHYRLRADKDRAGLWVGNAFVKLSEIVPVLSELAGPLELLDPDQAETITIRVTKTEKDRLRIQSNQRKLPDWHLLREAVHAYGMI